MKKLFIFIFVFLSFWGCVRLPFSTDELARTRVNIDWTKAGITPNGATIYFYPKTGEASLIPLLTNEASDVAYLQKGSYSVLVFNETTDGHDNLRFRDIDDYDFIDVYTEQLSTEGKSVAMLDTKTHLILPPDILAVAKLDDYVVTEEMQYSKEEHVLNFVPERVTVAITVRVRIKGIDNLSVKGHEGVISGMAGEINLSGKNVDYTPVRNYFTFKERIYDDPENPNDGVLVGSFNSFGPVQTLKGGELVENVLTIELKLRNGGDFPIVVRGVTEAMANVVEANLDLDIGIGDVNGTEDPPIILPNVPNTEEGGSGMDADVDDWDEEIIDVN